MNAKTKRLRVLNFKRDGFELNKILNEWDFIGVVPMDVHDEYICLQDPILNSLYNKATREELSAMLHKHIYSHFRTDLDKAQIEKNVIKIMDWWNVRKEQLKNE